MNNKYPIHAALFCMGVFLPRFQNFILDEICFNFICDSSYDSTQAVLLAGSSLGGGKF